MDQATRLKWAAVAFTIFWIGGMLWSSGEYHPANIAILSVCGTVGGYLWYLAMRWVFQHVHLLNGDRGAGQERPR
jgi:polyferredoxin